MDSIQPEFKKLIEQLESPPSEQDQALCIKYLTADVDETLKELVASSDEDASDTFDVLMSKLKKKDEETEVDISEASPTSPSGQTFFATEADLKRARDVLFQAEEKARKAVKTEQSTGFKEITGFHAAQAKDRKGAEDEETKATKALQKEEKDDWDALMNFWKKQNKDHDANTKKLSGDESNARKALEKEELAELAAIGKHKDGEAKVRKGMEDTETSERNKIEKEELQELADLGKYRERQAKERADLEKEQMQNLKGLEKEEEEAWKKCWKWDAEGKEAELARLRSLAEKEWKNDKETKTCKNCNTKFGLLTRKHHCRGCGDVFCDKCTNSRIAMPHLGYMNKERACTPCYGKVASMQTP
eukprot:TRINITY_DN8583_c0_g1_i1.p1 TRINITY_DN8583_c0_g1~~TRINITY_DN8583_c0_g1_i1.p1  ORF type:complete len:374 (+),score=190.08 TRINITY_DN8583_c0_g1_i1:42-1124(+)